MVYITCGNFSNNTYYGKVCMYMSVTSNAPILLDKFYNNNNKNSKVYIQIVSDTKYNNIV